jgi:hypothetical protein
MIDLHSAWYVGTSVCVCVCGGGGGGARALVVVYAFFQGLKISVLLKDRSKGEGDFIYTQF